MSGTWDNNSCGMNYGILSQNHTLNFLPCFVAYQVHDVFQFRLYFYVVIIVYLLICLLSKKIFFQMVA